MFPFFASLSQSSFHSRFDSLGIGIGIGINISYKCKCKCMPMRRARPPRLAAKHSKLPRPHSARTDGFTTSHNSTARFFSSPLEGIIAQPCECEAGRLTHMCRRLGLQSTLLTHSLTHTHAHVVRARPRRSLPLLEQYERHGLASPLRSRPSMSPSRR